MEDVLDDDMDLSTIRARFSTLVNDPNVEKASALEITILQKALEAHFTNIIAAKDAEISRLNFELRTQEIRRENDSLQKRCSQSENDRNVMEARHKQEVDQFASQLEEHLQTINRLNTELTQRKRK